MIHFERLPDGDRETSRSRRGLSYGHVRAPADSNNHSLGLSLGLFPKMDKPLLPEEKLAILQTTDLRRKWNSLDDQRVCVLCDRTITGRQIEVHREAGGTFSVHCPTEGCPSVPRDWFYQGSAVSNGKSGRSQMREASIWE